ncbi:GNAT family N-acetyltransferase [Microbacterium gorillae]|uniref:GNAT family N-acetyltransferase n=1 Tax=Microbacterium gorillae TaxID=1231063 RepID=UPI00058DFFA4|nr:GNAT family protein [Microbacterium gorillae]
MISNFAPVATRPLPHTLVGEHVTLSPLTAEDLPGLYDAIGVPEVFAGGYGGGPAAAPADYDDFVAWASWRLRWNDGLVFAVRDTTGTIIGTSTMADFNEQLGLTHIGWTAYAPRVWGTSVNPETKLLLLTLAFASGYGRVRIMADERNGRSRAAIAKLGATFEGIARRTARRVDGSWAGVAEFSILDDEWPRVRAGLLARLGRSE